jgi:hypothetical protein
MSEWVGVDMKWWLLPSIVKGDGEVTHLDKVLGVEACRVCHGESRCGGGIVVGQGVLCSVGRRRSGDGQVCVLNVDRHGCCLSEALQRLVEIHALLIDCRSLRARIHAEMCCV